MKLTNLMSSLWEFAVDKVKKYFPYVLLIGVLVILGTYLWQNIDRYQQLFDLTLDTFFSLLGLILLFILGNGSINYFFYRALGVFLGYNESIGLATVNTLANQLPFAGGLFAKGAYLKKRYNLSYTRFLSATMALYVCFVVINGLVALMVLGYWAFLQNRSVPLGLVLGFAGMVASVSSFWIPLDKIPLPEKFNQRLVQMIDGWLSLRKNLRIVVIMISLQVIGLLIFSARLWISFHAFSQNVSYTECLLFSSATVLTRLISFAPGGLGVRECIIAGLASVLGFDPGISAVAVGLDRLVATSIILVLGSISSYYLSKKVLTEEETRKR